MSPKPTCLYFSCASDGALRLAVVVCSAILVQTVVSQQVGFCTHVHGLKVIYFCDFCDSFRVRFPTYGSWLPLNELAQHAVQTLMVFQIMSPNGFGDSLTFASVPPEVDI